MMSSHSVRTSALALLAAFAVILPPASAWAQPGPIDRPGDRADKPADKAEAAKPDDKVPGEDEALYSCSKAKHPVTISFKPETELKDLIAWAMGFTCKNFIYDSSILSRSKKVTIISPNKMSPQDASALLWSGSGLAIDLRSSAAYREGHIPGSVWSIRPKIAGAVRDTSQPVVLVSDDPNIARIAALDLHEAGASDVAVLAGGIRAWIADGQKLNPADQTPTDKDRIDFIFHTLGRNEGNLDAARAYIAWEVGLVDQLDAQERKSFRL